MKILDGKTLSNEIYSEIREKTDILRKDNKRIPKLAVIIVGEDKASEKYVSNKEKTAEKIGILSSVIKLDAKSSKEDIIKCITKLNKDKDVDGILVQLPLPLHINEKEVIEYIDKSKDVDGLTSYSQGNLMLGNNSLLPCTPKGVVSLLKHNNVTIAGKNIVIMGRSSIVGNPLSQMLIKLDATVTVVHSKTKDIKEFTKNADILIVAIGKKELVDETYIKEGAVVIDVGIHVKNNGKLCGDVNFESVKEKVHMITKVPGGVGPMTIASLMQNTYEAYLERENN